MDIPMSPEQFKSIPRHPDWKWEYWDGALHISHRPHPLQLVRRTDLPVDVPGQHDVRDVDPVTDRSAVQAFLHALWLEEHPYEVYEPRAASTYLDAAIERSFDRLATPAGAMAVAGDEVAGVLLLERPYTGEEPAAPVVTWLSVGFEHRYTGIARALLGMVCARLHAEGVPLLASGASTANRASLQWHWRNGFTALPDQIARLQWGVEPASAYRSS